MAGNDRSLSENDMTDSPASHYAFRPGVGAVFRQMHPWDLHSLAARGMLRISLDDRGSGYWFSHPDIGHWAVHATVSGRGEVYMDGAWRVSRPGVVDLIPAGASIASRAVSDRRWKVALVLWRHNCMDPVVRAMGPTRQIPGDAKPLQRAIEDLRHEQMAACDPAVTAAQVALVDAQAKRLIRGAPTMRLAELWARVDADPAAPWNAERMAEIANMSEHHLWAVCKAESGQSPMRQVCALRMQHAAGLLLESDMNVADVGRAVGYPDAPSFTKAFRRLYRMPPVEYRRRGGQTVS